MTAIHAPQSLSTATPFDRLLLRAAAGIDHLVVARVERRSAGRASAPSAQATASDARATALALGSNGILPR